MRNEHAIFEGVNMSRFKATGDVVAMIAVSSGRAALLLALAIAPAAAQDSADLARTMVGKMTAAERDHVVHGMMPLPFIPGTRVPAGAVLGAGYVPGVPRVGFPALRETDASLGVAYVGGLRHDGATALPSSLATAASFDPEIAYAGGAMVAREAAAKGFNVLLGGGLNLTRDPRGGRTFEYLGEDPLLAGTLARRSDIAIVFATQWRTEGEDVPDLGLPNGQDALIAAVAAANPHTIVVLQTGGPVLMPWLPDVQAVLEAWYPGAQGGEAIADALFGQVPPSGRLPVTFPASEAQLPRPTLPGSGLPPMSRMDVDYNIEGSDIGYRYFARTGAKPLFPFGFGLGYTSFGVADPHDVPGDPPGISVTVTNTGTVAGTDIVQLYLLRAPHRDQQRLLGWARVALAPHQARRVAITIDPLLLCDWDQAGHAWRRDAGDYRVAIGASATDLGAPITLHLPAEHRKP